MAKTQRSDLTPKQVHAIVCAMYAVAKVDKVQPAELKLMRQFYNEARESSPKLEPFTDLTKRPFSVRRIVSEISGDKAAAGALIEGCVLVAYADGKYSEAERVLVSTLAEALGVSAKTLKTIETGIVDIAMAELMRDLPVDVYGDTLVLVRRELSSS